MKYAIMIIAMITLVFADDVSIDADREECETQSSTIQEKIQCVEREAFIWDSLMNRDYKLIMNTLPPDDKALLREAQRKWLAYRDAMTAVSKKLEEKKFGKDRGILFHARIKKDMVKGQSLVLMDLAAE